MNQLSTHVILDPIGCLDSATDNRLSFGGQRSIQLSYGRLWASIDQTPASGNVLDIAGFCSIGLCVKAPAAKFGRSNRLGRASSSCAEGVPGKFVVGTSRDRSSVVALMIPGHATTSDAARSRRADRGPRRGTSSYRYQRRLRRLRY